MTPRRSFLAELSRPLLTRAQSKATLPAPTDPAKTAELLDADVTEIALTENVTAAMSYLASGMSIAPGSEILLTDQEHPDGLSPWLNAAKRHGATVQTIRLPKPAESADE